MITPQELSEAAADTLASWMTYIDVPGERDQVRFSAISATTTQEGVTTFAFIIETADVFHTRLGEGTFTIQASLALDTADE